MGRIYFLILMLVAVKANSQFSGKVTYEELYRSKTSQVHSADLQKYAGTKRILYLQGPYYRNSYSGVRQSTTLYRGDVNKIFRFREASDTILWYDALKGSLSTLSQPIVEDSNEIILGLKCKKISFKSELGTTTYFFNDSYAINPDDFKNHHFENWDIYTSLARSIPLRVMLDGEKILYVSTATKIEPMKLTDSVFKLPAGFLKKVF